MAEYYVVLKRAVSVIDPGAIDTRRAVYDKARSALVGQLKAIEPPLSTAEISRQRLDLEEAIRRVEREAMSAHYADSTPDSGRAQPQRGRSESIQRSVAEEVDLDLDLDLDADFDQGSGARRSQTGRGRSEPREIFQRALKDSEYEPRPREAGARRTSEDSYEPVRRSAESERRPQPSRRDPRADLAGERPPAQFEVDDRDSNFDDGQDDFASEPQLERRPRAPRKGEASRAAPRMPDRIGGDERPRRSMLPLILTLLLLIVAFGGAAVFFYNVPEARKLVASVISSFDRQEKPAAVAQAPSSASAVSEKTAERLGAPPSVRTVDSASAGAAPSAASPASGAPRPAAAPTGSAPQAAAPVTAAAPRPNAAPAQAAAVSAPQKAMLYEESMAQDGQVAGSFEGNVVWQFVENGPDGPAIEGVVTVPDRKLRIQISIRRNGDARLPASHLVELAVNAPADFAGGGIANIPQLVLKAGESTPGTAMAGVPTKVVEGLFWIALSNDKKASGSNISLMKANAFMDVPLLYKSGQRAILTLAKGEPGTKAFERAMAAWGN